MLYYQDWLAQHSEAFNIICLSIREVMYNAKYQLI